MMSQPTFILTGDRLVVRIGPKTGFVPFIRVEAQAGFLKSHKNTARDEDYEWYRVPGFTPETNEKLFEIEGKSLIPAILGREL